MNIASITARATSPVTVAPANSSPFPFGSALPAARAAAAALALLSGAQLLAGDINIGHTEGVPVTKTVSGTGTGDYPSPWDANAGAGTLYIGRSGTGTLIIKEAGIVTANQFIAGSNPGALGDVLVTGPGSTLTVNTITYVGNQGSGTLTISTGGAVTSLGNAIIGNASATGKGTVLITGPGSKWTITGETQIGAVNNGSGLVTIENGGTMVSTAMAFLGHITGVVKGSGTAVVRGAGSVWQANNVIYVGRSGNGSLSVENGGRVNATTLSVGANAGAYGVLNISGPGAIVSTPNDAIIGNNGDGVATIFNGGMLSAPGKRIYINSGAGSGLLNIGGALSSPALAPGIVNAERVTTGVASGTVRFNHTSTEASPYYFTQDASASGSRVWITGNLALVHDAGHTVLVNDNNNHSGGTVINGGVLQLGNGSVEGEITGNITNNAELAINHSDDHALAGIVSGNGVISQKGSGVLTLNAANVHTGGVRVDSGTLAITADSQLGNGGVLALNGGVARFDASITAARSLAVSSGGGRLDMDGNDVTFTGTLTGSGALEKTGAGALSLSDATGFTGSLTITAGALRLGAGSLSMAGAVIGSNASLEFSGGGDRTLNTLSGAGSLGFGTGTLTVNATTALDYAGTLSGADGSALIKTGLGSLTLSGATPVATGFGADVSLSSGALAITGGTLATTGDVSVATGGTLGLIAGAGKVESASITFDAGSILNIAGFAAGAGNTVDLVKSDTAITTFGNLTYFYNGALPDGDPNDYRTTGLVLAESDTIIRLTSVLAWNVPNNAHGTFNLAEGTTDTISDILADVTPATVLDAWDGKTLTKTGAGTLILAADNLYTGTTFINGGTLQLGAGGATGSVIGAIVNNAVLAINHAGDNTLSNTVSGSGEIVQAGSGVLTLAGANTHTSGARVRSGTLAIASDAPLGASTGALTLDGGDARFDAALNLARPVVLASGGALDTNGRDITLSGAISGTGSLRKTGAGALVLGGANTFTGATVIAQGTLHVGTAAAAAGFAQSAGLVLADAAGAVFDVNNQSVTLRSLAGGGTGGGDIALGASGTLAVAGEAEQAFHGKITGGANSAFIKTGPGALTLDTPLLHTGATVIRNGVLRAGAADMFAAGSGLVMTGGVLDMRGRDQTLPALSGGGGEFLMRTNIEAGTGDLITLAGSTSGDHLLTVENTGGTRTDYAQLLIATPSEQARAATFALTAPVNAGIYAYDLAQRDDGWYLQNLPSLSPAGQALLYTAGSIGMEWQYSLDSLGARLGDLRRDLPLLKRKPNGNVWMTLGARRVRAGADLVGSGFNEDIFELASGLDRVITRSDTALLLAGLMVSTSRVDRNFTDNGDGSTTDIGIGAYASWLHDAGWFVNLMLKADRLQNSLNAYGHPAGRTTAEYNTQTWTGSLEAGKRLNLSKTWWLEPSVQVAVGKLGGASYTAYDEPGLYDPADRPYYDDDILLDVADTTASQYRATLRVGRSGGGKWHISARIAGVRSVSSGGEVVINVDDYRHTPDYDGWRFEAGVGASRRIGRDSQFYIDYEYVRAKRYDIPWSVMIGCRRLW